MTSGGSSFASGTVLEVLAQLAKKPNSGVRKIVKVRLHKDEKIVTAFVPYDGGCNYIEVEDRVLLCGMGNNHMNGVHYKVVKVNNISLHSLYLEKK